MSRESTIVLNLHKLTKSYGRSRGIDDVTLGIHKGEIFGFLGPNGAGKSTTINTILDLLRPTSGKVTLFGVDANKHAASIHKRIGFLSGDMETDPSLTGKQYLDYAAHLRGGVDKKYVQELTKRLRCQTNKKIKSLSRGNRQKIGLVAALMHDPDILILDEPTSGLDPLVQKEFNDIIREHKERGKTTFMSSHVLSEVQEICDRVGFIREGHLVSVSPLKQLMSKAPRRVRVEFKSAAPDSLLSKLDGISKMSEHENVREFTFKGDYNKLIHVLTTKDVADLQILEPSLDELFMDMYSAKDGEEIKTDV